MATETKRMRCRQSDSATAKSKNETLRLGELFYETDTGEIKIGDGVTRYNALLGIRSESKIAQQLANGTYKGTDLSVKFATEIAKYGSVVEFLHARCAAGNFTGIYPFDYWYENTSAATIMGTEVAAKSRKCVIAGIDLYYNTGDTALSSHHLTIFAGLSDFNIPYNDINNNNGTEANPNPWRASKLFAVMNGVNNAGTNKIGAVGYNASSGGYLQIFSSALRNRMVEQRCFLPTRYSSTAALTDHAGWDWYGRGMLFAPSEIEAYGCLIHSNKPTQTAQNPEGFGPYEQFPIFKSAGQNGRLLFGRSSFWLSSVAGGSSTGACIVSGYGNAHTGSTSSTGIRAPLCFHIA